MGELRKRYFERLDVFRRNNCLVSKSILNYRYGELFGLLDAMKILNMISYVEYVNLMNELAKIYDNALHNKK